MVMEELVTVLGPQPLANFVETPALKSMVDRALTYIEAGFPIHFRGVAGTGKTTLAIHVASKLGRPLVLIHGDEELSTSELVGGEYGYRMRKVRDNYIHTVLKLEEDMSRRWVDNRLTVACKYGFTLIYDEFTRSRPEANNIFLAVLQERMLDMPAASRESYLKVDPNFAAIFTSNPEEYAGVYRSQDALRDRMITLDLDQFDQETEIEITQARSGIERADAERIVQIVRSLRESGVCEFTPSVRGCIMVATAAKLRNCFVQAGDSLFRQFCLDILASESSRGGNKAQLSKVREVLNEYIDRYC